MNKSLPSFQIDITEELISKEIFITYLLAENTRRICLELTNPIFEGTYSLSKSKVNENGEIIPGVFFTGIALKLSALQQHQLLDNFHDIRVVNKTRRTQKNYSFRSATEY